MCKKLIYLVSFVLVLGLVLPSVTKGADPDLLVWYKFDETSGTIAHDSSGNGHDGTLNGDPKWVPGQINGALDFGGDGDYVIDDDAGEYMNGLSALTVALWIKSDEIGTDSGFIIFENPSGTDNRDIRYDQDMGGGLLNGIKYGATVGPGDTDKEEDEGPVNSQTTDWQHIAVTWHSGDGDFPEFGLKLYINGLLQTPSNDDNAHTGTLTAYDRVMVGKGGKDNGATEGWDGLVDDVRVYSRVLTAEEIQQVMIGIPPELASDPSPANEATDVPRDVVLSWTPGEYAPPINGHKVYLSENFNDVNDGIGGIAQDANSYAWPQRLDFGTTYYWRIDEVNGPPDYTVYEGDLWSFTTEPFAYPIQNIIATASSNGTGRGPENTVNGSGLDDSGLLHGKDADNNMWLSGATGPQSTWIEFQFDNVYKLHELWVWNYNEYMESVLGLGCKDVSIEYSVDGTDYTPLGTTAEFARAPGAPDYEHNTTIDFGGATAKYVRLTVNSNWGGILPQYGLSEVRFSYIPVWAREPSPGSGTTDVDPDVVLGWRAGREAATHDVYLSTDEQAVIDGTAGVATMTEAGYDAGALELSKTYYWKINEVNEAETPTTWESDLWSFTTREFLVVDDFESYNDLNPEDPESNRIFNVWIDGYGISTNGSLVGYDAPPFAEQSIVHSGTQSMPLFYDNSGTARYSEAELTLSPAQDWTKYGVKALSLWFHGDPDNAAEQMYVKVDGSKVVYDGDAADIRQASWQEWNIDLALFGASLQNVTKLSIGVGDETGTTPGGSGKMLFDDIRLYPSRCIPSLRKPQGDINNDCVVNYLDLELMAENWLVAAEAPGNAGLVGHWEFEGNANDSSGKGNHGTLNGSAQIVSGELAERGQVLDVGQDDGWVEIPHSPLFDITNQITVAAWIKVRDFDDGDQRVICKGDNMWRLRRHSDNSWMQFRLNGVAEDNGAIGTTSVDDGEWHHVAGTYDQSNLILYVDAAVDQTVSAPGNTIGTDTGNLFIGIEDDMSDDWNGLIDDVRVYDYALSLAEIIYLARSPVDLNQDNKINFKDYAVLAEAWLDELLWPQP